MVDGGVGWNPRGTITAIPLGRAAIAAPRALPWRLPKTLPPESEQTAPPASKAPLAFPFPPNWRLSVPLEGEDV